MRALVTSALAAVALAGLASGPVHAAGAQTSADKRPHAGAPYPQSTTITGITWQRSTYRSTANGGDIWPVTSGADGAVYTAWGDGAVAGCRTKVSYGTAAVTGGPGTTLRGTGCGPAGEGKGKIAGLVAIGNTLYAVVNLQDGKWPRSGFGVWRSNDKGKSWQKPSWKFSGSDLRPEAFVNYGAGYSGARDGYVYLTAFSAASGEAQKSIYLMRVPQNAVQDKGSYQYLSGLGGGSPTWSGSAGAAQPIFVDRSGSFGANIVYNAGLGRYLLTVSRGTAGKLGVFEGPEPWGPWSTVAYESNWLGIKGGDYLGLRFPSRWMSDGGKTLWAVFSCYGCTSTYHDRYNLIQATLTTGGRADAVAPAGTDPTLAPAALGTAP